LQDKKLLVGAATSDDAGVYQIDSKRALVQTVDFFTPIVDDPYTYGLIAAANSLSDIYAMGGRPLTAMNIMGVPEEILSPAMIHAILRGGAVKAKEARCVLLGGHTIRNPEPIYGLSVTGLVSPRKIIANSGARPGDLLVLTKPLGTGVLTTALKRDRASSFLVQKAVRVMAKLNTAGADLAEAGLVKAGTDITGFGLLGHLASMCKASGVGAELFSAEIPIIDVAVMSLIQEGCIPGGTRDNREAVAPLMEWGEIPEPVQILLSDAQTSGGLLICVPPKKLEWARKILRNNRALCDVVIGRIVAARKPGIQVHQGWLTDAAPSRTKRAPHENT
jgi:selenide,water dikinase